MKLSPNPYNLIVPIKEGKKKQLINKLEEIQADLYNNSLLPFGQIKSIHFARFVILHKTKGFAEYPDQLVFSTNYHGELDEHLKEIIHCPGGNIDQIFTNCQGYESGDEASKIKWMKAHAQLRAYFYRGTWGLPPQQISDEDHYRQLAEAHLDRMHGKDISTTELRSEIQNTVKSDPRFKIYERFNPPKINFWEILKLIFIVLAIIIFAIPFLLVLLFLEISDDRKQYDKKYSNLNRTKDFVEKEDKIVQNQLTHLVEIKPGWFRLFTLKLVLNGIAYLAKYVFNKGKLGGIPTIHYARWIIIDKGRRLLFFSNFDGSWESYLGDFVDKAAVGLTGVWSNTQHFPKTRFLLFKGARDEQRFKSWARSKQEITNVWYSAYPDLTVTNIAKNRALQEGLCKDLSDLETKEWLLKY